MVGAIEADASMHERLTLRYPEARALSDNLLTRAGETVTGHEFHRTVVSPTSDDLAAWDIDGAEVGFATETLHASYLHTHWAGHPQLAQRFADAVHAHEPRLVEARGAPATSLETAAPEKQTDPLRFHGDAELGPGLTDLAVNVFPGPPPPWLTQALRKGLEESGRYPDAGVAERAVARQHGVDADHVLATAGAAEAFTLVATMRTWRRPVVVHPQFTEPQSALARAGHLVTEVRCPGPDFELDPDLVPEDADLVVVGNPTNPTGVLHPATLLRRLARRGRLVVVDEAFVDTVEDDAQSLAGTPGVLVLRSLTKHWGIPGVRAGYAVGDAETIHSLRDRQTPWSVSACAAEALVVCTTGAAATESGRRRDLLLEWRRHLEKGLVELGVPHVPSATSFVLVRPGAGVHAALGRAGFAVRRCDTFPGLDDSWIRIAARPPEQTDLLLHALTHVLEQLAQGDTA
jgi:cobyrinic acid a,c-diamide synthase